MIGFRTAILLFVALVVAACWLLHGPALIFILLIIGALAAKTCVHHFRKRLD
jgi:hypothetical protein